MSSGFHAHLLDDTSAFVVMWQEIEEEREDTSFVQMKRGRHRYPGLGTRMKLHWGSSRFFRRSGAAAGRSGVSSA